MLFAIMSFDKADSLELRQSTRQSHIEYLKSQGDRLKLAGPLYEGEDVGNMNGSLVVIDADNIEAAQRFAANDPYALAGLFETVHIRPWNLVVNQTSQN